MNVAADSTRGACLDRSRPGRRAEDALTFEYMNDNDLFNLENFDNGTFFSRCCLLETFSSPSPPEVFKCNLWAIIQ